MKALFDEGAAAVTALLDEGAAAVTTLFDCFDCARRRHSAQRRLSFSSTAPRALHRRRRFSAPPRALTTALCSSTPRALCALIDAVRAHRHCGRSSTLRALINAVGAHRHCGRSSTLWALINAAIIDAACVDHSAPISSQDTRWAEIAAQRSRCALCACGRAPRRARHRRPRWRRAPFVVRSG